MNADQDERPLNRLREAHLTSSWNYRKEPYAQDGYRLKLDHLWPVFQLPSIEKLSIFDLVQQKASHRFENKSSTIKDLTLVYHNDLTLFHADDILPTGPAISASVALPRILTRLSIYFNDFNMSRKPRDILSNTDLWTILMQHQELLQHLDIYRDSRGCEPTRHTPNNLHFGSMNGFRCLRRLNIQPEVILGGFCGDRLAPFSLGDTLPHNIESLTLYGEEGLATIKSLGAQLQHVISGGRFPRLSYVCLEPIDVYQLKHYTRPTTPTHGIAETACRERGITFKSKPASSILNGHGGLGTNISRK